MRRTDRYLLSEMFVPAFVGVVMLLLLLIGNWLYYLLRLLYQGASWHDVGLVLVYRIPEVLMLAIPGSLLLGTALALNRLERDRELLSLRMAGVRLTRLVLPFILVGVLFSIGIFVLQEVLVPKASHQAELLTRKMALISPTTVVPPDQVFMLITKTGKNFIYVREVDAAKQILYGVIVWRIEQGRPSIITIPVAENRGGVWYFNADPTTGTMPQVYFFGADGAMTFYMIPEGRDSLLDLKDDVMKYFSEQPSTPAELSFRELQEMHRGFRGYTPGIMSSLLLAPHKLAYHLHRKLAVPVAALVGVLIAIPLAIRFGRSGGYTGLLLSMVVAFCFVVSQQWTQVLAETGRLNPIFAAWAPDGFFGLLGLLMLLWEE